MKERIIIEASPRFKARLAGICEALEGLTATIGQVFILNRLVIHGNAAATATNILAHEQLFQFGFAVSLMGVAFHIAWALLFYDLFKPVNRSLSLMAAFFGLVTCAMEALTGFFYIAPLLVLHDHSSLSAFTADQLQALAYMFLRLNGAAFNIDLTFFGFWCILTGYLIYRSTFLPRILGILLMIDGAGWALYLSPPLATHLFPLIAVASGLAEFPLQLWLLIVGLNAERWKEQASAATEDIVRRPLNSYN
jgi:uncharacterized protein DUF4386